MRGEIGHDEARSSSQPLLSYPGRLSTQRQAGPSALKAWNDENEIQRQRAVVSYYRFFFFSIHDQMRWRKDCLFTGDE